ncbi:hypothetical protein AAZX31_01G198600 [Glycine max]|uniref:DUF7054 domain-containing protein n=1 Tax=Glycine max TaxID=3847 RepID=I1J9Z5_SOYBN|nr:uncharacterized protein LOC100779828 [Glycine max]KAG5089855.1 hypothetical protein JHK86_002467 [Glycine max]KAH1164202.1 hypothetical protein GYH30_002303 [Glycine max]KAH1267462.1 Uncharacterized protein GmHk_01G002686 [Glycine max]KRH77423.1 hypothetical protein GLYMA_01G212600v4 [Glycine max]|eukprot:XP_003517438.1 uncharacterized protein LOC100779828 [Glycine max]
MGGIVSTPPTHKFPLPTMETCDYVRPSKLLLNVTIENSLGAIQVLLSPEDTVADLVNAALLIYEKEKRRPLLKDTDPKCYDLHYSPYTLQSLKPNEKLKNLGSRNFFLRLKPLASFS